MIFTVHHFCGKGLFRCAYPWSLGGLPSFPGLEEVRELQAVSWSLNRLSPIIRWSTNLAKEPQLPAVMSPAHSFRYRKHQQSHAPWLSDQHKEAVKATHPGTLGTGSHTNSNIHRLGAPDSAKVPNVQMLALMYTHPFGVHTQITLDSTSCHAPSLFFCVVPMLSKSQSCLVPLLWKEIVHIPLLFFLLDFSV